LLFLYIYHLKKNRRLFTKHNINIILLNFFRCPPPPPQSPNYVFLEVYMKHPENVTPKNIKILKWWENSNFPGNICDVVNRKYFSLFSLFWKNKTRLMRLPCCLCPPQKETFFFVCIRCCENMFTETLPRNSPVFWVHYCSFQASCHIAFKSCRTRCFPFVTHRIRHSVCSERKTSD
jgi:hypothetical protein